MKKNATEKEKKKGTDDPVLEVDQFLAQDHLFIKKEETMRTLQSETDPTIEKGIRHAMMKEVTEDPDHRN